MGSYISQSDVEDAFGIQNVLTYSNLDPTATIADTTRIATAIENAEEQVNNRLRNGPYVIPFGSAPKAIVEIAALLAGVWLYQSRGVRDDEVVDDKMTGHRERAAKMLSDIVAGILRLDAPFEDPQPSAMVVV